MARKLARRTFAQGGRPWLRCSLCKRYRVNASGAWCAACRDVVGDLTLGLLVMVGSLDVRDPLIQESCAAPRRHRPKLDANGRLVKVNGLPQWEELTVEAATAA